MSADNERTLRRIAARLKRITEQNSVNEFELRSMAEQILDVAREEGDNALEAKASS
jgi:hypothetical protein